MFELDTTEVQLTCRLGRRTVETNSDSEAAECRNAANGCASRYSPPRRSGLRLRVGVVRVGRLSLPTTDAGSRTGSNRLEG
jgi:hypothetical protein